jgi:hypothetical protein
LINPIHKKWLLLESESQIIYNAVRLDQSSVKLLKDIFPPIHPNIFYHHMTINFGVKKYPESIGNLVELFVIGYQEDKFAQAVVVSGVESTNKVPHITLSTAVEIKPAYSNEMLLKGFKQIKPFKIRGIVSSFKQDGWFDNSIDK